MVKKEFEILQNIESINLILQLQNTQLLNLMQTVRIGKEDDFKWREGIIEIKGCALFVIKAGKMLLLWTVTGITMNKMTKTLNIIKTKLSFTLNSLNSLT